MSGARLQIVRRFRAAPERVFAACSDPELIRRWYGPREFRCIHYDSDFRVGGRFTFRMVGPPGEIGAEGRFESIEPPRLIVLTWQWVESPKEGPGDGVTSRITYLIEPDGAGSVLTFTQDGLPDDEVESHTEGWSESLDKLEQVIVERSRS